MAGMPHVATLENFIGGRWTPSSAASHLDVTNPAKGVVIARTPMSTAADVDAAVKAAAAAFPGWSETPPVARARTMFAFRPFEFYTDKKVTISRWT